MSVVGGWRSRWTLSGPTPSPQKANIILFEANSNLLPDLMTAVHTAADFNQTISGVQNNVSVVLDELGVVLRIRSPTKPRTTAISPRPPGTRTSSSWRLRATTARLAVTPAYSPNVVAVGGTELTLDSNNNWQSERVSGDVTPPEWGQVGSGYGPSLYESEPAYQAGVQTSVPLGNR